MVKPKGMGKEARVVVQFMLTRASRINMILSARNN